MKKNNLLKVLMATTAIGGTFASLATIASCSCKPKVNPEPDPEYTDHEVTIDDADRIAYVNPAEGVTYVETSFNFHLKEELGTDVLHISIEQDAESDAGVIIGEGSTDIANQKVGVTMNFEGAQSAETGVTGIFTISFVRNRGDKILWQNNIKCAISTKQFVLLEKERIINETTPEVYSGAGANYIFKLNSEIAGFEQYVPTEVTISKQKQINGHFMGTAYEAKVRIIEDSYIEPKESNGWTGSFGVAFDDNSCICHETEVEFETTFKFGEDIPSITIQGCTLTYDYSTWENVEKTQFNVSTNNNKTTIKCYSKDYISLGLWESTVFNAEWEYDEDAKDALDFVEKDTATQTPMIETHTFSGVGSGLDYLEITITWNVGALTTAGYSWGKPFQFYIASRMVDTTTQQDTIKVWYINHNLCTIKPS